MPVWLVELTSLLVAVVIGVASHALVLRRVHYSHLLKHNDVAGFLISVVAVLYGVVLGFVVIIVWGKYDDANHITQQEISAVANMYRLAEGLPADTRDRLRGHLLAYAKVMVSDEWPAMDTGSFSLVAFQQSVVISREVIGLKPTTAAEINLHAAMLQSLSAFLDARRNRLRANHGVVQPLLWWTLFLGMVAVIGFSFFFGMENRSIQLGMTAIICAVVMSMLVLVAEYDTPFSGALRVPSSGWSDMIRGTTTPDQPQ
jgi:hypothetical protein